MNKNIDYENTYTVEVYKKDKRITYRSRTVRWGKNKPGLRFVSEEDYTGKTLKELEELCKSNYPESKKFVFDINKTYVKRKNLMSEKVYWERFNMPYYCSPSSETYWSM
jgi:aspartyl-tRNA synthetase